MVIALLFLGLLAGVLTTIAGQGGGLVLLLASSALLGPHAALALTAPALLLGNLHRAVLFRTAVDRPIAGRLVLGAVPGALAGGLLVRTLPPSVLEVVLVMLTAVAIAKAAGLLRFEVPRSALVPAGLVVGVLTGTAGGAGMLLAPILLATGLSGVRYVATTAAVAVAMHAGRVVAYGANGMFSRDLASSTAVVTAAIFAGNALGDRIRRRVGDGATTRLEYGVLVACVLLSLAGFR